MDEYQNLREMININYGSVRDEGLLLMNSLPILMKSGDSKTVQWINGLYFKNNRHLSNFVPTYKIYSVLGYNIG